MTIVVLFCFVMVKGMVAYNQNTAFLFNKQTFDLFVHIIILKLFLGWLLLIAIFCNKKGEIISTC